jgi:hypothetical protein
VALLTVVYEGLVGTGEYGCWLVYHFDEVIATNER